MKLLILLVAVCGSALVHGDGLIWPDNELLPSFSTPAAVLDCIDVSSVGGAQSDLFASLEGIVNRSQPRVACVIGGQEGAFTWLNLHNLPYTLVSGLSAVQKYLTNVTGLVVTDPTQPDTLNLATTIAGVSNELICDPSLLSLLTNAPYSLTVRDDLRGRFSDKYQVYRYLYTNYWPQCTHRMLTGLQTNLHGNLRDYAVALKAATVWLDPGIAADASVLGLFASGMTAAQGVYTGWWPSEGNGLNWIYQYGIPVLASDFFVSASVYSGVSRSINVPDIPPPPPLQNKVYVAMILSDGDNIQYMQHAMKLRWDDPARGSIPLGWTTSPLAVDVDRGMLNFYWSTATSNDCLIAGPSGAGYTHMQRWSAANLAAFAKVSDPYLRRSGLRLITTWDQVTTGVARSFATNCPTLLGLTDQSGGTYTSVNLGLRTVGLTVAYSSDTNAIYSGITNAARNWNGTAPLFLGVQADTWNMTPTQLRNIASLLDTNKYVLVRPDHLLLLYNSVFGYPSAATRPPTSITAGGATLQAFVLPNSANTSTWMEWGTNSNYGFKTVTASLAGTYLTPVSAAISGLAARTVYHYRAVASNALGAAFGADMTFAIGNRIQVWGDGSLGQTNLPPGLTNVVGISCGANHGLALKNDGNVIAWGDNSAGQATVPAGLTSIIAVAGGGLHSLALNASGAIVAWGDNAYGQTNVPLGLSSVVSISAGAVHNLALKSDGTVVAWGDNSFGQTNIPVGLGNVVAIAAGGYHSLALRIDGTVVAWGRNDFGQTNVPAGLSQVVAVAAGQNHSLALKAEASLGIAPQPTCKWIADSLAGADGSSISNWTDVAGGKSAVQNFSGNRPKLYSNVLNGHNVARFTKASSHYLTVAAASSPISAAGSFTLVMVFKTSTTGDASSLFYNNTGLLCAEQPGVAADWALCVNGIQLGVGLGAGAGGCASDLSLYGGNVTDGNPHCAMYVRAGDTMSLYVDGARVAGQSALCAAPRGNYSFQIGAMTASSHFFNGDIAEVQLYDRALNAKEIVRLNEILSSSYGVAGAARTVVAWGANSSGQTNGAVGLTNLTAAVCGGDFNLGLRSADGSLIGWGDNGAGQLSWPSGLTNVAAVAAGGAFSLAIGNQAPYVEDTVVSGYVSHDLTFALPGSDPDANPLSFRVLTLPGAGALYQYSNGARGVQVDATNLVVSDSGGRLIFAPVPNETGNPYTSFRFIADDGYYSSGNGQVTVNIGLPAAPQFTSFQWEQGNDRFLLHFTGDANATYSVWASTNLLNWESLGTAAESGFGQYDFIDSSGAPERFYRAGAP